MWTASEGCWCCNARPTIGACTALASIVGRFQAQTMNVLRKYRFKIPKRNAYASFQNGKNCEPTIKPAIKTTIKTKKQRFGRRRSEQRNG
jgi:hypothetical protein